MNFTVAEILEQLSKVKNPFARRPWWIIDYPSYYPMKVKATILREEDYGMLKRLASKTNS